MDTQLFYRRVQDDELKVQEEEFSNNAFKRIKLYFLLTESIWIDGFEATGTK